jgi:1-acyl-sn-glycerol-3-phosphate acyltransferase
MVYFFSKVFFGILIGIFTGKIDGKENLRKGNFIIAANHSSFADDFILTYNVSQIAQKKFTIYVNSRFYKKFLIKKFLDHYNLIPVDVSKDVKDEDKRRQTNEKAFSAAAKHIKDGGIFMIFPEGGRSEDGKLRKAKTGVARLALTTKVPVIPVGIKGSYEIMPKGAKFPRFKKADLNIGKPISFEKYYGKEKDYKTLEDITTIIMKEIARLTNQEYKY